MSEAVTEDGILQWKGSSAELANTNYKAFANFSPSRSRSVPQRPWKSHTAKDKVKDCDFTTTFPPEIKEVKPTCTCAAGAGRVSLRKKYYPCPLICSSQILVRVLAKMLRKKEWGRIKKEQVKYSKSKRK